MLRLGENIPGFSIPDQDENAFDSKQLIGKNSVIFFYPKDESLVCTIEACSFRNGYDEFNSLDATVVGISADSPESHQNFIKKYSLNYTLLSDMDQKVAKLFGLEKSIFGLLAPRVTFVFDTHGKLIKTIDSRWDGKGHMKEALEALKKA